MLLQVLWVLKESFVGIELPCVYSSIGVATITIPERCAMCLLTDGGFLHGMMLITVKWISMSWNYSASLANDN